MYCYLIWFFTISLVHVLVSIRISDPSWSSRKTKSCLDPVICGGNLDDVCLWASDCSSLPCRINPSTSITLDYIPISPSSNAMYKITATLTNGTQLRPREGSMGELRPGLGYTWIIKDSKTKFLPNAVISFVNLLFTALIYQ